MLTRVQHKAAELQASAAALDKAFIRLFSQLRWTADAVAKARGLLRVIAEASAAEVLTDICAVYHHATSPLPVEQSKTGSTPDADYVAVQHAITHHTAALKVARKRALRRGGVRAHALVPCARARARRCVSVCASVSVYL